MCGGRRNGHFFILYIFPGLVYYQHMLRCYRNAIELVFQKTHSFSPAAKDEKKIMTKVK